MICEIYRCICNLIKKNFETIQKKNLIYKFGCHLLLVLFVHLGLLDRHPLHRVPPDEPVPRLRVRHLLHRVAPHVGQEGHHGLGVVAGDAADAGDGELVELPEGGDGALVHGDVVLVLRELKCWFHEEGESFKDDGEKEGKRERERERREVTN